MAVSENVLEQFVRGNADATRVLVEMHNKELFNLCFRLTLSKQDAEDLYQATWMKAIRNANRYSDRAFRAWLFKICINQYRDNCRKEMRRGRIFREDYVSSDAKDILMEVAESKESVEVYYERQATRPAVLSEILFNLCNPFNGLESFHDFLAGKGCRA